MKNHSLCARMKHIFFNPLSASGIDAEMYEVRSYIVCSRKDVGIVPMHRIAGDMCKKKMYV